VLWVLVLFNPASTPPPPRPGFLYHPPPPQPARDL